MKITAVEAKEYLYEASTTASGKLANQRALLGLMVTTKVRSDVLTDSDQGLIIINGTPKEFKFKSIGGGVWHMTIGERNEK